MFSTTNYQNEHLPQKISIKELSDELLGLLESVPQKSEEEFIGCEESILQKINSLEVLENFYVASEFEHLLKNTQESLDLLQDACSIHTPHLRWSILLWELRRLNIADKGKYEEIDEEMTEDFIAQNSFSVRKACLTAFIRILEAIRSNLESIKNLSLPQAQYLHSHLQVQSEEVKLIGKQLQKELGEVQLMREQLQRQFEAAQLMKEQAQTELQQARSDVGFLQTVIAEARAISREAQETFKQAQSIMGELRSVKRVQSDTESKAMTTSVASVSSSIWKTPCDSSKRRCSNNNSRSPFACTPS